MDAINRPLRVFLCHSAKDWQAAHDLFLQLKHASWLDVWFVGANLDFNQNWDDEIRSSVRCADAVIALISWRSFKGEAYLYPDPNFVFDLIASNPRDDLLLLPLILGRFGVSREMIASGLDYSQKNQRHSMGQQILADLRKYADENGFSTDGSFNNDPPSDSGIQWSPSRWKELKNIFNDSTEGETDRKTRLQQSLKRKSRVTGWLFVSLLLVTLIIIGGIGIFMSFTSNSGNTDSAVAPLIGQAMNILSSPVSDMEQEPAIPPTFVPGMGDVQFSAVDDASMVYIPAGSFTMGSNYEEREQPIHSVNLPDFWMDKLEVTNQQYARCVQADICSPPAFRKFYDNSTYRDHPVVYVDWDDAKTYCEWAGRRLPTEAEWEKSARGTDKRLYPWGTAISCETANYNKDKCMGGTTAVGSYPAGASPYGVLDLAGNVWEWVSDWYDETYYMVSSLATNPLGPRTGEHKVLRGGSWISTMNYLRTTDRWRNLPAYNSDFIGFRCAMSAVD